MRRTKEDAEQTRQALLDAALAAFSNKGYQATRLQEIAEMAGATRGAIYHHFENKADLYKQLLEDASQQGSAAIQTAVSEGGTFAEICRRIFVTNLEMLATNQRFRQVMSLSLFKTGVSPELAQIENERLQNATAVIEGIAAYMQYGIETGEVRTDLAPDTLARAFLALQNGAALLWLANGEFFSLSDDAPIMVDIFLQGILQSS